MKAVGLTALETEVLYYVTEVKKSVTTVFIRSPSSSLCQHKIVRYNIFLSDFYRPYSPPALKYKSLGFFHFAAQSLLYWHCRKKHSVCECEDMHVHLPGSQTSLEKEQKGSLKSSGKMLRPDSDFCGTMIFLLEASWKAMFFSLLWC